MQKQKKISSTRNTGTGVWGIRGVSPETRTAVNKAARRAGVGIGEYVDRALRDAATDTLKDQPPAPRIEDTLTKLAENLAAQAEAQRKRDEAQQARDAEMAERLGAIEARTAAQAEKGNSTPAEIFRALSGLFRTRQTPSAQTSTADQAGA